MSLLEPIIALPHKRPSTSKAGHRKGQVEFNNGPHPQAAERRRSFHDGEVAICVADVDEVAARNDADGEEDGLTEERLEPSGEAGKENRVRRVRVEGVE
jgi:hypothetical protein